MNRNYSLIAIIALILSALTTQTAVAETKPQLISLLNGLPKADKTNCDASDLMSLLTTESLQWVESIECENVNISKTRAGVELGKISNGGSSSYIKFNFKKENLMKMVRIRAYGVGRDKDNTKVIIYCNNDEILVGNWKVKTNYSLDKFEEIEKSMNSGSGNYLPEYIMNSTVFDFITVYSITLSIPYQSESSDRCQFFGLQIFYDGTVDETGSSDIGYPTIVDEIDENSGNLNVEYFDMMGRRLPEKPQTGIYIRKTGAKTEKLIAR